MRLMVVNDIVYEEGVMRVFLNQFLQKNKIAFL